MLDKGPGILVALLMVAGGVWVSGGSSQTAMSAALAADQPIEEEAEPLGAGSQMLNPHSDLIFRATRAKSCRDCHRVERDNSLSPQVLENDLVRNLRSKAEGIHGPGRFADCLRCHAGGRKGVEKY
jgi:cytochrome c2